MEPPRPPYSLALGLDRHPLHYNYPKGNPGLVSRFAATVTDANEVLAYPDLIERNALSRPEAGDELEAQLLAFMEEAQHIHFQLDGVVGRGHGKRMQPRQVQALRDALTRGELGTSVPRNVTSWELFQVWNHFRDKATFYWKRKTVDLSEILSESEPN